MNQLQFQQAVLAELQAIRAAIENNYSREEERREALTRANFERDQAFSASVSSGVQELRERVALLDQKHTAAHQHSMAHLFGLAEIKR
jgi:hypothetical protein